jgi:hypothetical protein
LCSEQLRVNGKVLVIILCRSTNKCENAAVNKQNFVDAAFQHS